MQWRHQKDIDWGDISDFMSALKMVLHVMETLKINIQKNLTKS